MVKPTPPPEGLRKYRLGQQGTLVTAGIVAWYLHLAAKAAEAAKVPLVVDGGNVLMLAAAAVVPILTAMGTNVWTHYAKRPDAPQAPSPPPDQAAPGAP